MTKAPWVIVSGDFRRGGGMDRANLALAEYLVEQDREVHIVAHSVDDDLARRPSVTVHSVTRPAGSVFLGEPLLDRAGRKIAQEIVACNPATQVVVNGGNCLYPGVNWVHCVHHAWVSHHTNAPRWYRMKAAMGRRLSVYRERKALRISRIAIANSERTRRYLIDNLNIDSNKIATVYLGGDPEWGPVAVNERVTGRDHFRVNPNRLAAVFLGALGHDTNKGLDTLLDAWRILEGSGAWDVDLLVAGRGSLAPWRQRVAEMGLSGHIHLIGFCDQVRLLLATGDVLVSPVRYESYGLNVHEAICRGIPAMVSACAGVAERYPAALAPMLIENPEDASELANRLLAWRTDVEGWKAKFKPFSDALRSRTWRDMAEDFVTVAEHGTTCASRRRTVLVQSTGMVS